MELPLSPMRIAQLTAEDRAIFNRFPPGTDFCYRLDDRSDALAMAAARADFGSVVDAVLWEQGGPRLLLVGPAVNRQRGLKRLRVDLVQMLRTSQPLARSEGLL
jgi:hypothetical protein